MTGSSSGSATRSATTIAPLAAPDRGRELRAHAARKELAERRKVTDKLQTALAENGFVLHYQPKIHLVTGQVTGAEAMIRMMHRRRGLLSSSHFMPVAERSEIVNEISAWMLHQACAQAMRWPERLSVSLNISQRLLRSGKLTQYVIQALAGSGLPAARLQLEISEAMLIDEHDEAMFALRAARGLGIGIALDDFGADYGSLSVLRRMPLTAVKLDRSVVTSMQSGFGETAILRAAIETGHALQCVIVADGVETERQFQLLRDLGCDEAQGSFFSPPLPDVAFIAQL